MDNPILTPLPAVRRPDLTDSFILNPSIAHLDDLCGCIKFLYFGIDFRGQFSRNGCLLYTSIVAQHLELDLRGAVAAGSHAVLTHNGVEPGVIVGGQVLSLIHI